MPHPDDTADAIIARIATRQHGGVARRQLLDAGLTREEIRHRLSTGALLREHPGVYRVGHRAFSVEAIYLAAVLACGDGALLAGRAAAHVLGILDGTPPKPEVITLTRRRIVAVITHRTRSFDARDAARWKDIPVTTVPRTLVDLAATLDEDDLARACHKAAVNHRTTPLHVEAVLSRRPNSPGARKLRRVLFGEVAVMLSRLERRFRDLLRGVGLPLPQMNRVAGGRCVDCRWPEHRLTVELDSYTYHSSRYAWELDRRREREAYARGDEFRRYTYGDVLEHPEPMLRELRALFARRRGI